MAEIMAERTTLRVVDGEVLERPVDFKPVILGVDDRFRGAQYHWSNKGTGWRIGFGPSNYLLAEGAGWSAEFGKALYEALTAHG